MAITSQRKPSKHACYICGAELSYHYDDETDQWGRHWVESGISGNRYCWPGEGCFVNTPDAEIVEEVIGVIEEGPPILAGDPVVDPPEYAGHFPLELTDVTGLPEEKSDEMTIGFAVDFVKNHDFGTILNPGEYEIVE